MKRIFIDSDIFVRDLRYPRDLKTGTNEKFLRKVKMGRLPGTTSIFNLLEVCGIISFNISAQALIGFYADFCRHYNVKILFPADTSGNLQYDIPVIFEQIQKRESLGDAQVNYVAARFAAHLNAFVSWNAAHFHGKLPLPVKLPEEFL